MPLESVLRKLLVGILPITQHLFCWLGEVAALKTQFLKHHSCGRPKSHPCFSLKPYCRRHFAFCSCSFWTMLSCWWQQQRAVFGSELLSSSSQAWQCPQIPVLQCPLQSVSGYLPLRKEWKCIRVFFAVFHTLPTMTLGAGGVHHPHSCAFSAFGYYSLSRISGEA